MIEYGVVKLIVTIISEGECGKEMLNEVILLSIALLLGGN